MENCTPFIEHILNTTSDELLLRFWRQQLQKEQEKEAAADEKRVLYDGYQSHQVSVLAPCPL